MEHMTQGLYTYGCRIKMYIFNPLNAELNTICHLLALLGAHLIFHVSGIRVKVLDIFSITYFTYYVICTH
jgi:hypothetical protein